MNIIILGPQGSGKGTQAELVAQKYNLTHVETGKILREIATSEHPLAQDIRETMNDGRLVSDEVLESVIGDVMDTNKKEGFVFDGTPRDLNQYRLIDRILGSRGEKIDMVILIDISEAETIKRLTLRRTCKRCGSVYNVLTKPSPNGDICGNCGGELVLREDDKPDSIKNRLRTYHEQTDKVINEADKRGLLIKFDGERPIGEIFNDIAVAIEHMKPQPSS